MIGLFSPILNACNRRAPGAKLDLAGMARTLKVGQSDVIASVERLIASGQLDASTLRSPTSPTKVTRVLAADLRGKALAAAITKEAVKRGRTDREASTEIFGHPQMVSQMRVDDRLVRRATRAKIDGWLAAPWTALPKQRSGTDLGAAIRAEAARRQMRLVDAATEALGAPTRLYEIERTDGRILRPTLARVDAWLEQSRAIAAPPSDVATAESPPAKSEPALPRAAPVPRVQVVKTPTPRRDPTTKPETPVMDAGDRRAANAAQHGAAVRRGIEREAAALVDAGADISKQNSMIQAMMRDIIARRADAARAADPVEKAKLALRRRGRVVFDAAVLSGGTANAGQYMLGRRLVDRATLLAEGAKAQAELDRGAMR